jgi:hypothetical protein
MADSDEDQDFARNGGEALELGDEFSEGDEEPDEEEDEEEVHM